MYLYMQKIFVNCWLNQSCLHLCFRVLVHTSITICKLINVKLKFFSFEAEMTICLSPGSKVSEKKKIWLAKKIP